MAEQHTIISVRGEATRIVEPDFATVRCGIHAVADTTQPAVRAVETARAGVVTGLTALGGVVLTAASVRDELTWTSYAVRTADQWPMDDAGTRGPVRRRADIDLAVTVRDFSLLREVGAVLTALDAVSVRSVTWSVDEDNDAWSPLRAEAIDVALRRGRDYAAALGARVVAVEQVADAGLLDGSGASMGRGMTMALAASGGGNESGAGISLDPVPQEITAVIDARVVAAGPSLDG